MSAPSLSARTIGSEASGIGIAEMSSCSGLSQDTLRWYEREGLIPNVPRATDRRRIFTPRMIAFVQLLARLRATGMPTADMRTFVTLVEGGSSTHQDRIELLSSHRARIAERQTLLAEASNALEAKIAHYRDLIERGLDCDGQTSHRRNTTCVQRSVR